MAASKVNGQQSLLMTKWAVSGSQRIASSDEVPRKLCMSPDGLLDKNANSGGKILLCIFLEV
jgi:hypothetical protein